MFPRLVQARLPLLLLLLLSLAVMRPAIRYPVVATDAVFVLLAAVLALSTTPTEIRARLLQPLALTPIVYWACLAASLPATSDVGRSVGKLLQVGYLVLLPAAVLLVVRDRRDLVLALRAWLAGTALAVAVGAIGLLAFLVDPDGAVYRFTRFYFGTLPPGDYPRIRGTFFNAHMLCDYLTVSLGVCAAHAVLEPAHRRWSFGLAAGIVMVAVFTISPGLGGVALALGGGAWAAWRVRRVALARIGLAAGVVAALVFVGSAAITPIVHPTAPFLIEMPITGRMWAPSGRFLTWSAALAEFGRRPRLGHGIGVDAVDVPYRDPSGELQQLTDAHNMFLNVAAQAGLIGLAGLLLLIGTVVATALRIARAEAGALGWAGVVLAASFLNGFAYHGLTGSFEDARFLWVVLGLVFAVDRLVRSAGSETRGFRAA